MTSDAAIESLSRELGDEQLARSVIGQYPDLAARTELLSMTPPRSQPHRITAIIAFAFGNRLDGGLLSPGPVNEALARTVEAFAHDRSLPVFAQWEIADLLSVPHRSIQPPLDADGKETYLSTEGVVVGALQLGIGRCGVGVVAFSDHAVRCVMTCRKHGLDAAVPEGVLLPSSYDPLSGQPWTRDRAAYIAADMFGRLALG